MSLPNDYRCDDQLTIFDWMPDLRFPLQECELWPKAIRDLAKDIHDLFIDYPSEDDSYRVWQHVPNLGKRYQIWIHDLDEEFLCLGLDKLDETVRNYKDRGLDISVCQAPTPGSDKRRIMISTIWNTRGHHELKNS